MSLVFQRYNGTEWITESEGDTSGSSNHASLTNLSWLNSRHTGAALRVAGFDADGNAVEVDYANWDIAYTHTLLTDNPHSTTKAHVGLSDVPNTDFTASVALNTTHRGLTNNPHTVTNAQVGLGNVTNDAQLKIASNLSDLNNTSTARTHLGLGTASVLNVGVAGGNIPILDGGGKINSSILPALAISETFVVANQVDQLALTVQEGDVAVRSDENKSYIALNSDNANMGDWQELLTPTDSVQSVFGRQGAVTAQAGDYTWAQINKTTSNIADIALRSHTNLTDIGTNTHAQIDTAITASSAHIADNSQAHSDYLINNGNDSTSGSLTASSFYVGNGGFTGISGDVGWLYDSTNGDISTTGKVGVGTDSPSAKLHVLELQNKLGAALGAYQIVSKTAGIADAGTQDFSNNKYLVRDNTTSTDWTTARWHDSIGVQSSFLVPGTNSRVWWERDPNNNIQSWGNGSDTYLTINDGDVGIGTVDPQHLLEVSALGTSSGTGIPQLSVHNSFSGTYDAPNTPMAELLFKSNDLSGGWSANSTRAKVSAIVTSNLLGSRTSLGFYTSSDNSLSQGMILTHSGDVGIGTGSPDTKLHVSSTHGELLRLEARTTGTPANYVQFEDANGISSYVGHASGSNNAFGIVNQKNDSLFFGTNSIARMTIDNAGNVGIGTTSLNYKLQVNGTLAPETTRQDLGTTALRWDGFLGSANVGNNLTMANVVGNRIIHTAKSDYDKIRVWSSGSYTIGMKSAQTFGDLNDYAMTFTMNNDADRGFLWRDSADSASDGAMSLTTGGKLHVKTHVKTPKLSSRSGTLYLQSAGTTKLELTTTKNNNKQRAKFSGGTESSGGNHGITGELLVSAGDEVTWYIEDGLIIDVEVGGTGGWT